MTNTAIVNRIEDNKIYLMHINDYGKKESVERSFWNIQKYDFQAINNNNLILDIGDAVEYTIPQGKTIFATFLMLILPLITFLVSYYIFTKLGIKSEKIVALISLIVMFLTFYLSKLFKHLGGNETLPNIISVQSKEDLSRFKKECKDCGSCTICN
ncbi:MAG: SoxR reducing system RseC family protein [Spirochaetales bacterium]|nr:SoxR reducing system RseC family protein [Spirochaetales bacterium]